MTHSSGSLARSALIAGAILVVFTVYSLWVVAGHGYTGFLSLAAREPWGMQLLLDLVIASSFGIGWMHADARRRGMASWPYVPVVLAFGSIGLLSYVVVRGLRGATAVPAAA
jgi:hypothetical protein